MRWPCLLGVLAACGSPATTGDAQVDAQVDVGIDGSEEPTWSVLVERGWTLDALSEAYKCRRIQVPEDMYITGFSAMAPPGTHHTLLTLSPGGTVEGDHDCLAQNLDPALLFASGIGTGELLFPEGVAMRLSAGQYVTLNLHLFNATDEVLAHTSGIRVRTVPASQVEHEADMMFVGTTDIAVPGTNQPYKVSGGCTAPTTWHVFTIWPHMHAYAKRQQVSIVRVGGAVESLLDIGYTFQEQKNYPMAERQLDAGDRIEVTCTYQNGTGMTVYYGDSATEEMCFAGMYKYPAGGQTAGCIEMP